MMYVFSKLKEKALVMTPTPLKRHQQMDESENQKDSRLAVNTPTLYDESIAQDFQDGNTQNSDISDEPIPNRSLLANAFEGVAQSDIEKQNIQQYREKTSLMNAEEAKLRKLNEQIRGTEGLGRRKTRDLLSEIPCRSMQLNDQRLEN